MPLAPHILPHFFYSKQAGSSSFQPLLVYGAHLTLCRVFSLKTCGLFVISASVSVRCAHLTFCRVFHSKPASSSWFQPLLVFGARISYFAAFFFSLKTSGLFVISSSVSVWCAHLTFCPVFFTQTYGLFVISASLSVWCAHLTFCRVFSLKTCGLFVISASVNVRCAHLTPCRVSCRLSPPSFSWHC